VSNTFIPLRADYTHVLWFVPPQLISGTKEPFAETGCWYIESWAHYNFGQGDPDAPSADDLPKNADLRELAAWVAEELGHPVTLEPDPDYFIQRGVFSGRVPIRGPKIRTPLYYVHPAAW
jgi:hypothetical protein